MVRMTFVVMLPMLLLGALGDGTDAPACNDLSCNDACTVNGSCEPVITKFDRECDDPYWDEVGVHLPPAGEICTQCCDENCEAVQTFPNCSGDTCNQCHEPPSEVESVEHHTLTCCSLGQEAFCSICTIPDGWTEEWTSKIQELLPYLDPFSMNNPKICGERPSTSECYHCDIAVISKPKSCRLTEDSTCRAWYYKEEAPACESCLPQWNKTQFVKSEFERKTIQCKEGKNAKCERVPTTIVDVQPNCWS